MLFAKPVGSRDLYRRLALQPAQRDEELVHFQNRFLVIISLFPLVEESVRLAGVDVQVRSAPRFLHQGLVFLRRGDGDQAVLVAEEDDGRWRTLADVVDGGNLLVAVSHSGVTIALGTVVVHGIEKSQGVRLGRYRKVFALLLQSRHRTRGRCHVPAGGTSARRQTFRIDPEFLRVLANPANGRLPVLDALEGWGALPRPHPIVGTHGDHAARGEVFAMRRELGGVAATPTATEEEYDRGPLVLLRVMPLGIKHIQDQLRSTRFLVDHVLDSLDRGADFSILG